MIHPHFTPEVTLGHLMQAGVLVTTLGGGVLGAYLTLRADLDTQSGDFRAVLAGHEARIAVLEHALEERRTEDRAFQAEMRVSLDRVMAALADLRTEIVQKQDRR